MWYQSFWFTQLLIIAAITLAFFVFIYPKEKRWALFVCIALLFLVFSGFSIFFQVKHSQKLARFKVVKFHFKSIKDLSDFEADKYSAILVTQPNLTTQQIKAVIAEANRQINKRKSDASVVWLSVFDDDNAIFDKPDKQNPHFVAQAQWRKKDYVDLLPQSFISNDNYKGIEIFFNQD